MLFFIGDYLFIYKQPSLAACIAGGLLAEILYNLFDFSCGSQIIQSTTKRHYITTLYADNPWKFTYDSWLNRARYFGKQWKSVQRKNNLVQDIT